ncbi:hypothetical protein OH491_24175 [Termitidicoccus mucosus]|uniref:Uncharacterized protein n=1 Tax=Termitidicoccus mucosus TaxID=1184151 RepID=A0A178IPJ8_9BACT|nr:hypothetical protein AW736_02280 [Opitutaceae bacterium TSB47]
MHSLESAIRSLDALHAEPKKDFFQKTGIRLRILKNEAGLSPCGEPQVIRARLWNLGGNIRLELETWKIESPEIIFEYFDLGDAETQKQILVDGLGQLSKKTPDGPFRLPGLTSLLQTEITSKILETLIHQTRPRPGPPSPPISAPPPPAGESGVIFTLRQTLETLDQAGSISTGPGQSLLIEEGKNGVTPQLRHLLSRPDRKTRAREITRVITGGTNPCETLAGTIHETGSDRLQILPFETVETLIEEQVTWADWLTRTKPNRLESLDVTRYLHKSNDQARLLARFGKLAGAAWRDLAATHAISPAALILSAAAHPKLAGGLARKIQRHPIDPAHPVIPVIKNGLLNRILIKHAWIFSRE